MLSLTGTCLTKNNPDIDTEEFTNRTQKRVIMTLTVASFEEMVKQISSMGGLIPAIGMNVSINIFGKKNVSYLLDKEVTLQVSVKRWRSGARSGIRFNLK